MLIAGNWKMNLGFKELEEFFRLAENILFSSNVDLCIIPPAPLLREAKINLNKNHNLTMLKIGAQNTHYKSKGAFTGDISPNLLHEIGCNYVLTGHSERRIQHHESNEFIKNTVISILSKKMVPIICVGEPIEEKNSGNTKTYLKKQIQLSVPIIDDADIIIAYEPIWAIGTGKTPLLDEIQDVHEFIKNELKNLSKMKVIYGGSVNKNNCDEILSISNVDGALVGGASLNFKEFLAIYNSAVKQLK